MTEIQVGRLRVTIPDDGTPRCGIHNLSTDTGRCAGCDAEGSADDPTPEGHDQPAR